MTISKDEPRAILFLDFDGTVADEDAVDALLEAHADPGWIEIESEWQAGRIGSRDCLASQVALVTATHAEVNSLLDTIGLDPGLEKLVTNCASMKVPVYIVSDGFDYCINRIITTAGASFNRALERVQVFSSHLASENGKWIADFPYFPEKCNHGCATCKPAVMRLLNPYRALSIFVGDGLSDKYAVAASDVVFAKGKLADYCSAQNIPFLSYHKLNKVAAYIESLLGAESSWTEAESTPVHALSKRILEIL